MLRLPLARFLGALLPIAGFSLSLPVTGWCTSPAEQAWMAFRNEHDEEAAGPKGYLAFQDVLRLERGQSGRLVAPKDLEKAKLALGTARTGETAFEFDGEHVWVREPAQPEVDLLAQPEATLALKTQPLSLRARKPSGSNPTFIRLLNFKRAAYAGFKGFPYFPYSPKGVVRARLEHETPTQVTYVDTLGLESKVFRVGRFKFKFAGKDQDFPAYSFEDAPEKINSVNLLFTDRTSGKTTYGGGRVVYLEFPAGKPLPDEVEIDFNRAYSFLCAHAPGFRCPNRIAQRLDAEVPFGERHAGGH